MTIIWSDRSLTDLRAINDFIARDSPMYAGRQIERLISKVEQTSLMPTRGHPVHEHPDSGLREVHEGGYRIIYRLSQDEMQIVTLIHMKQDMDKGRID